MPIVKVDLWAGQPKEKKAEAAMAAHACHKIVHPARLDAVERRLKAALAPLDTAAPAKA